MDLIVKNRIIRTPITTMLEKLKQDTPYDYLNYIGKQRGDDVKIQCPFHNMGQEKHPSCHVYAKYDNPKIYYGTVHCFTCNKRVPFYSMVGYCLDGDDDVGKQWLVDNFGDTFLDEDLFLDEIVFEDKKPQKYLDESILEKYNQYHPYMTERKLTPYILKLCKVGYDSETNALTFPVWDSKNNLLFITRRCVDKKLFILPENIEKPVYLLNLVINQNYPFVVVCEGQIDALVSWSYGIPAVALFGAATTDYQIAQLKKSGIRNFVLCYDNDEAGRHGATRFKRLMNNNVLITDILMPVGKDIADCSYDEYMNILKSNNVLS